MNYENIIELLLLGFPNLREKIEVDDYLRDLPHCIFEMILIPYIKGLSENAIENDLIKMGDFFEQMATCEDKKVNELFNVSFLEPVVLADKEIIPILQIYMGKKSLEELNYWLNRYGQEGTV